MNPFGHMDLRLADIGAAQPFYDALLPALGFTERYHGETWKVWATTDELPGTAYFGVTESAGHVANENRIAFWLASREDVERVATVARDVGALELSGPKEMPYGPGYCATYSPIPPATGSRSTSDLPRARAPRSDLRRPRFPAAGASARPQRHTWRGAARPRARCPVQLRASRRRSRRWAA